MNFKLNLFVLCILVSLIYPLHLPIWTTFHSEFMAFLGLGFISFNKLVLSKKFILYFVFIFIALSLVSFSNNTYYGDYIIFCIYSLGSLIAYGYGVGEGRSGRSRLLNSLFLIFIISGLTTSIIVFSQFFSTEYVGYGYILNLNSGRPFGNLAQPNQAATLLVMGWVSLCYRFEAGVVRKFFFIVGSALLLISIVLTQSRTAFLSVFFVTFSAVLLIINFGLNGKTKLNINDWLVMLAMYVIATFLFHFLPVFSEGSIGLGAMVSKGTRFIIWSQIFLGLMESPWIGYGLLQASSAQQVGSYKIPGFEQTNYSHNLFLDLLVWFGMPIGIALIFGLFLACFILWRRYPRPESAWLLIFLIPFLIHSMLEMPFSYAYFLFPVFIILGCINSFSKRSNLVFSDEINSGDLGKIQSSFFGFSGFATSFLFILISSFVVWDYLKIEEDFRVVRFENLRVGKTPENYKKPEILFLNQLEELMDAMRMRAKPNMSINDIELLKRVCHRHPWAPLHFRLTLALALNKEPDLAVRQLNLMLNFFGPNIYEESILNLIDLQSGSYPELDKTLKLIK